MSYAASKRHIINNLVDAHNVAYNLFEMVFCVPSLNSGEKTRLFEYVPVIRYVLQAVVLFSKSN